MSEKELEQLHKLLINSKHTMALTGAGISKASGIPPFRGSDGIWNKYDPMLLDLNYFLEDPAASWQFMADTFFQFFHKAEPNPAHVALSQMEKKGLLQGIITQNIDTLHQRSGSTIVMEFHGGLDRAVCLSCKLRIPFEKDILKVIPPLCPDCGKLLKPDIVFFSEAIPQNILYQVDEEIRKTELLLVIGTSAEVYPASFIPSNARQFGAEIVEINPMRTSLTDSVSDLFIAGKAEDVLPELARKL